MLSTIFIATLLTNPATEQPRALLQRAQQARQAWVESCAESRYELCASLGRRSRHTIEAECVNRLPVHSSPPPEICAGWIGTSRSPDRLVRRIARQRKPSRRALAQLQTILDALDALDDHPAHDDTDLARLEQARAIALLTIADDQFERWLDLPPPPSIEAIGEHLQQIEQGADHLVEAYAQIAAMSDPDWSTAALARIALVHQVAIQRTRGLPIPKSLRHRGYWYGNEFCGAVDEATWEWSPPLWSRVTASYRLCAAAIRHHKRVGPIAAACEVEGAMLGIEELTPPAEFVPQHGQTTVHVVAIPVVLEP